MHVKNARIVIVGSGILGSAVAYALATRGETDVLVVEAEKEFDKHSTGRSAAYFIPMYESIAYAALSKASLDFLTNPPEGFADTPIFRRDGAIIAAPAGAEADIVKEIADSNLLGLNVKELDGSQIQGFVPAIKAGKINMAAYYPEAGEVDVNCLSASYRRIAQQAGVEFATNATYHGAKLKDGRITAALVNSTAINCEIIVNAAGAWAGYVGRVSGASVINPLVLRRHLIRARIENFSKKLCWPFFRCPALPLYFKLSHGELVFSPMDATPTYVGPCVLDQNKVVETIATLKAYTNFEINSASVRAVAGHRVFGPDKQPLLGPDPRLAGFFWAAGMGGAGIMASSTVGDIVSAEILGLPAPVDYSLSALTRFYAHT